MISLNILSSLSIWIVLAVALIVCLAAVAHRKMQNLKKESSKISFDCDSVKVDIPESETEVLDSTICTSSNNVNVNNLSIV